MPKKNVTGNSFLPILASDLPEDSLLIINGQCIRGAVAAFDDSEEFDDEGNLIQNIPVAKVKPASMLYKRL